MRILITGGAGCLGANLVERYIPLGHEIMVVDNFATGSREVLPPVERLQVVEGSITDAALVERCFTTFAPTHVIHSAAAYKDPEDWREDAATNVLGTINMADASRRHGVRRLVNLQTALCYGKPSKSPIPIDHPARPFTSYGISKTAGEQYLMMLTDVPVISLRLANVTGPHLAIGPIPTFYKRLKSGQSCFCSETVRDFLDMSDFFSVMDIAMQEGAPSGVFNISTGEGHSIKEIFDIVVEHTGAKPNGPVPVVPPGADDVPVVVLDPSYTKKVLGWEAKVGFVETIRQMLAWYDAHGVGTVYSHLAPQATRAR